MHRAETIARAQALRRNSTGVEQRLWDRLRTKQLGVKFRRQHPIGPYIADFACCSAKLVVELDGDTHIEAYDARRDQWMEGNGWRVMRIVLQEMDEDIEGVVDTIRLELAEPNTMLRSWSRLGLPEPARAY
jgi:very-short-patch-repair endonuclease